MIIIKQDPRSGEVKVKTETLDDLWHLEKVIEEGDLLTARTLRKTTIKRGSEIREGDRVLIDLTTGVIEERSKGIRFSARPIPDFMRAILKSGGLVNYLKKIPRP